MIETLLRWFNVSVESTWFNQFCIALAEASAIGGAIVVFVVIAQALLHRRVPNNWLYLIWGVVLLRFVLLWAPSSPTSVANFWTEDPTGKHFVTTVDFEQQRNAAVSLPMLDFNQEDVQASVDSKPPSLSPSPSNQFVEFDAFKVIGMTWITVFVFLIARLFASWLRLRCIIRAADSAPPSLTGIVNELRKKIDVRDPVELLITDEFSSPATTGIIRPVILLPINCVSELTTEELRLILTHELIHVKRSDTLLQLISWFIGTIHWFNPLARLALRRLEMHREISCDQAVISAPVSTDEAKSLYGRTILKLAQMQSECSSTFPALARSFTGQNKNLIKQRIEMIIFKKRESLTGRVCLAALVVCLLAGTFTSAHTQEPDQTSDFEPKQSTELNTAESPLGSSKEVPKTFPRNDAWPKPFSSARIRFDSSLNQNRSLPKELLLPEFQSREFAHFIPENFFPEPWAQNANSGQKPKAKLEAPTVKSWSDLKAQWRAQSKSIAAAQKTRTLSSTNLDAQNIKLNKSPSIELLPGTSKRIAFEKAVSSWTSTLPARFKTTLVDSRTIEFTGTRWGNSNLSIVYSDGSTESVAIHVVKSNDHLKRQLDNYFPNSVATIVSQPDGIVLHLVNSAARSAENIIKTAEDITGQKVSAKYSQEPAINFDIEFWHIDVEKFRTTQLAPEVPVGHFKNPKELFLTNRFNFSEQELAQMGLGELGFGAYRVESVKQLVSLVSKNNVAVKIAESSHTSSFGQTVDSFSGEEYLQRNFDGKFEKTRWGHELELTAVNPNKNGLTIEIRYEFSTPGPPFQRRRLNTGARVEYGQTYVLIRESEEDKESTMVLITPKKLQSD